jgi:hypothetical protein
MNLLAPTPSAPPGDGGITNIVDTEAIISFVVQGIVPILIVILGVVILGRAKSGRLNEVMTTSTIAFIALGFIGGAGVLMFLGDDLVNLIVK